MLDRSLPSRKDGDGDLVNQSSEMVPHHLGETRERAQSDVSSAGTTSSPGSSTAYVWYVVGLLSLVNLFSYMDRTALSVLLPSIKADLQLKDGQLGLLVGFAFFLFYATCGIPIARLADRSVRKNMIAIALVVWSAMAALSGAAQNFWHLLLARMGLGAGEAGCVPAGQSIISDYVGINQRSTALAINTCGMSVGTMSGLIAAGWLGEIFGWRWAFVLLALPGVLVAIIVWTTLIEPVRGAIDGLEHDQTGGSMREALRSLWECRTYRRVVIFFIMSGFANAGLSQWWPSFYSRVFDLSLSSMGIGLGTAIGVGSAIGTILGAVLTHRAMQRDVKSPLLIASAAMFLAIPAAFGSLFVPSASGSMLLASLTFLLWAIPSGPITATIYNVTKPRMRATASACTIFLMSILGFGLGPLCVGVLSDLFAASFGVEALRYALLLPASVLAGLCVALYMVAQSLPHDLKAAGIRVT